MRQPFGVVNTTMRAFFHVLCDRAARLGPGARLHPVGPMGTTLFAGVLICALAPQKSRNLPHHNNNKGGKQDL